MYIKVRNRVKKNERMCLEFRIENDNRRLATPSLDSKIYESEPEYSEATSSSFF